MLRTVIAAWVFDVSLKAVEGEGEDSVKRLIGHKVLTV